MAVLCPAGDSEIEFKYETPGLKMGIFVTLSSAALFILYLIISAIYQRRADIAYCYPEGDELLAKWAKEETAENVERLSFEQASFSDWLRPDEDMDFPQNFAGGFKVEKEVDKTENE